MKKKTKKQKKNQIQNRIIYSFFQVPNKQKTNKQIRSFIVNGENFPMSAKEIKSLRDERRFHLMNEKEIDKLLLDTDDEDDTKMPAFLPSRLEYFRLSGGPLIKQLSDLTLVEVGSENFKRTSLKQ